MSFTPQEYHPNWWAKNRHLNTIIPNQFRKFKAFQFTRKRITTPDNDFLDLDFSLVNNQKKQIVLLLHGLEGSSNSGYIKGLSLAANAVGLDAVALNFRGCSGEPNNSYQSYHSGKTDDIETVVNHLIDAGYQEIALVGYSLGGNATLRFGGEQSASIPDEVKALVGVSVPVDLHSSAKELERWFNKVYLWRFIAQLRAKVAQKIVAFPLQTNLSHQDISKFRNFFDFDDAYTAPAHGFKDAKDYYTRCSSLPVLKNIAVPALLLNAKDDSFLGPSCYPEALDLGKSVTALYPNYGGHVGFIGKGPLNGMHWSETTIVAFVKQHFS